jgi:hypothetical protein
MSEYISLPPSQRTRHLLNAAIHSVMLRECLDRLSPADRGHILTRLNGADMVSEPRQEPAQIRGYGGRQ